MNAKFHLITRIVDMERPLNNKKDEKDIVVTVGDYFERHGETDVFKLVSATGNKAYLEYNRLYSVRDEHKGYEFNTTLELNESKEVSSMWGRSQVTIKITYKGIAGGEATTDNLEGSKINTQRTINRPEDTEIIRPVSSSKKDYTLEDSDIEGSQDNSEDEKELEDLDYGSPKDPDSRFL
ncbi:MAG: hypothetical protein V1824_00725 [archaeon]